jgi:cobyrinic acid a,c-diamide synthase
LKKRSKKLSLILAAPRSGSGKTTVTMALAAAFRRRGLNVAVAKSGPDYIDPAFHAAATGRPAFNLDSWAMPPAVLDGLLGQAAEDADLVLIEASMGLFDGAGPKGQAGRAADLAARWAIPILLVMDVSGQSQTAAATARGFIGFEPGVTIAGVILNRLGSAKHEAGIRPAMEAIGLPVLGSLLRDAAIALPERHLGLVQAEETGDLAARISQLAERAEARFDLDAILALAARITIAAGPADRGGARRGLHLPLPASAGGVAAGGRRDHPLLAARGRAATGRLRCLLAARRLPGTAWRPACRSRAVHGGVAAIRRDASGAW